jgi:hypothetical protein
MAFKLAESSHGQDTLPRDCSSGKVLAQ